LRHPSFSVESSSSYGQGLEQLLRSDHDACIVDYQLGPGPTGFDLLREARKAGCDIPILLLTADGEEELDVVALRAGAADYLEKSGLTEELTGRAVRYAVERGRSLEALRQSEARHRSVFEDAPYGMWRSRGQQFTDVNAALVGMLGYNSTEDLMSIDITRDLFQSHTAFEEAFANVRRVGSVRDLETEWRRKDGRPITVRISVRLLSAPGEGEWIHEGIVEDITEQQRLAAELRQAQKMDAIGRLAGGIAHDFNNLLTAILGYAEILSDQVPSESARRDLGEIHRAGTRAADLTRQLLAFSRKQMMKPIVCDLNEVASGACGMLRRVIGEDIQFTVIAAPAPVWVNADPGQIEQVLMNLVVNARDAMPEGGFVTIETSTCVVDPSQDRSYQPMTASTYALMSVSDTGCGMDEETLSHLFEPFFTTKPRGKGTGLGLATVYGIVKQSGGFIWADSTVGAGTKFRTYLPLVSTPAEVAVASAAPTAPQTGAETILLVEDEESVRKLASQVLKRRGYEVLVASNADEAQRLCAERADDIALLLTDVVMPGVSGPALARAVTALYPAIRVLYMSGYAEQSLVMESGLSAGAPFLPKPFTPDAMTRKVREVLDRIPVIPRIADPAPGAILS
jgi:PAS domain S-box-containing protein